jgi:anti-sigma regulatory factor (Ser/Thr protein kinase)
MQPVAGIDTGAGNLAGPPPWPIRPDVSDAATPAGRPNDQPWQVIPDETTALAEFTALPETPYWARRHAKAILGAWQVPPEKIETAVLLVSELVTNAINATARPERELLSGDAQRIVQTLRRQPGWIVIEVSDSDPNPPMLAEAEPDAESGRGLMLVQALSKEWSWYCPQSGGKTVYCILDTG